MPNINQLINFLFVSFAFALVCVIRSEKRKRKRNDIEFDDPLFDDIDTELTPAETEKRNAALKEIECLTTLIEQYRELYEITENALDNTYKEISRIRLQEKLINIECKINRLEKQKDKAYYIAYGRGA